MKFQTLTAIDFSTFLEKNEIADFLVEHLDQYGDTKADILKCLDYALSNYPHQGGYVLLARDEQEILGAAVMNQTGMEAYVPANILVYIAVHKKFRGQGLGKELVEKAIALAKGGVALHVEPDNPSIKLFEKLGFTNKYVEMRYQKD